MYRPQRGFSNRRLPRRIRCVTDSPHDETQNLPEGIEALRALVLTMMLERDATRDERDALTLERDTLQTQNGRLRHLLLKLTRMQFGAKSEHLREEQLQLGLEALEQAIAKEDAQADRQDPQLRKDNTARRRASRGALSAHLLRIEVTLVPDDTACPCCRAAMTVIGEDSSERLDVIPVQFRVIVTKRPKFACRSCAGTVVQVPAPARLIEGGIPTEALVAQVAIARFAAHQPLYRKAQMMARQGVILDRSTLSFWIGYAAAEVAPVVARLRAMMLASRHIFADETVVPVLDPGRGRTKQGYFWAIGRDDRPWRGGEPPAVVDSYATGRGNSHAAALLGGYRCILQCDGHKAYEVLAGTKSADPSRQSAGLSHRPADASRQWMASKPHRRCHGTGQQKLKPKNQHSTQRAVEHRLRLYHVFGLSQRDAELLLAERGIVVSYETVRRWCKKFGQSFANRLRRGRPRPGDKWHMDEVFIRICGVQHYLWRAVDQDGAAARRCPTSTRMQAPTSRKPGTRIRTGVAVPSE
jgi:transposase